MLAPRTLLLATALVAVVLAGCTTDTDGAHLQWTDHPEHGEILTDADGNTLYNFTNDEGGPESTCYDQCAQNWPPLLVDGEATRDADVTGTVGTTQRDDGSTQVTYDGEPLYYFANDQEPGDANGQGMGGVWFVVMRP